MVLIFAFAFSAQAQTQTQSNKPVIDDPDPIAQMLQQSIAEARANKAAAEACLAETKKKDRLSALDELEISKLKRIIEVSDNLIQRLEKQCTTTTFFWVIKFKRC